MAIPALIMEMIGGRHAKETLTEEAVKNIKSFKFMRSALLDVSVSNSDGGRYANPVQMFEDASQQLKERVDGEGDIQSGLPESCLPISTLARDLLHNKK